MNDMIMASLVHCLKSLIMKNKIHLVLFQCHLLLLMIGQEGNLLVLIQIHEQLKMQVILFGKLMIMRFLDLKLQYIHEQLLLQKKQVEKNGI